jgi:hypothetical protein
MRKRKPNYSGLRYWVKTSHGFVGVYDGLAAGLDVEAGRWSTVCESHGHILSHQTLKLARWHMRDVESWCDTEVGETTTPPQEVRS